LSHPCSKEQPIKERLPEDTISTQAEQNDSVALSGIPTCFYLRSFLVSNMSPTHTPQRSPIKVSRSESQEDIKSYELVDNLELDEDDQDVEISMRVEHSSPKSQIKQFQSETLAEDDQDMDDVEEDMPSPTPAPLADSRRQQMRTPEPSQRRSQKVSGQPWPGSPGALAPFDWEDFENRYEKALTEADQKEADLVAEFEQLVQVMLRPSCLSDSG
jgi:hypothetical protein